MYTDRKAYSICVSVIRLSKVQFVVEIDIVEVTTGNGRNQDCQRLEIFNQSPVKDQSKEMSLIKIANGIVLYSCQVDNSLALAIVLNSSDMQVFAVVLKADVNDSVYFEFF